MHRHAWVACVLAATPCAAGGGQTEEPVFDPTSVNVVDAIECRLKAPAYNGFAWALNGDEKLADRMQWRKIESGNPFLGEYELPATITVAGHYATQRIAFTSSGVVAVLDLPDPNVLGTELGIANELSADPLIEALVAAGKATRAEGEAEIQFRKFLGQQILSDTQEPPQDGESFGFRTVISRNVSNVTSHPDKTLYGCSYKMELTDKDGKRL